MYERMTDRARKVMQLANQEASILNHEYIGTEHILLALLKDPEAIGVKVLVELGADLSEIRIKVNRRAQSGPECMQLGKIPQTPRAKKVLEHAMEEACRLSHNYVGTEHLLLGMIREAGGVAWEVLAEIGITLDAARAALFLLIPPREPVTSIQDTLAGYETELSAGLALVIFLAKVGIAGEELQRLSVACKENPAKAKELVRLALAAAKSADEFDEPANPVTLLGEACSGHFADLEGSFEFAKGGAVVAVFRGHPSAVTLPSIQQLIQ